MDLSVFKIKSDIIEEKKLDSIQRNINQENYETEQYGSISANYETNVLEKDIERIKKEVDNEDNKSDRLSSEGSLCDDEIMHQLVNVIYYFIKKY